MTDEKLQEIADIYGLYTEQDVENSVSCKLLSIGARNEELEQENAELKEKLAGAERTRDNLIQLEFPTFQSCKEYADKMNYVKSIIKDLLDNSDEYARQRAEDFLKGEKDNG